MRVEAMRYRSQNAGATEIERKSAEPRKVWQLGYGGMFRSVSCVDSEKKKRGAELLCFQGRTR